MPRPLYRLSPRPGEDVRFQSGTGGQNVGGERQAVHYVLVHLPTEYKKLSIEGQKKMMRIVAKEVKLDMLSPHLFRLYIVWENGIAVRLDVALLWRGMTPNNSEAWTEEEDALMRRYYPDKPQIELMQALPRWAWNRILERGQVLKLRRDIVPSLNFNGPIQ